MNYFGNDDCFSDIYSDGCPYESSLSMDPVMDESENSRSSAGGGIGMEGRLRIGPFPLKAVNERGAKPYEVEIYEWAVRSFIEYLEERQQDLDWLLENQDLVIELFDTLIQMGESEDLLPALQILEGDPHFAEILDDNALKIMIQHTMDA